LQEAKEMLSSAVFVVFAILSSGDNGKSLVFAACDWLLTCGNRVLLFFSPSETFLLSAQNAPVIEPNKSKQNCYYRTHENKTISYFCNNGTIPENPFSTKNK